MHTREWEELYDRYRTADSVRRAQRERLEAEQEAFEQYQVWSVRSTETALETIGGLLAARAVDFTRRTQVPLIAQTMKKDRRLVDLEHSGTKHSATLVELDFGAGLSYVFGAVGRGHLPYLHIGVQPRGLRQRFWSVPGCALIRAHDGSYSLRDAARLGELGATLSHDDLAFRALEWGLSLGVRSRVRVA
jgi:hypothetical protein